MKKQFLISALACQLIAMIRRATTEPWKPAKIGRSGRSRFGCDYTMSAAGLQTLSVLQNKRPI